MSRLAAGICALGIAIGCTSLASCGSDSSSATMGTSTDRGTLVYDPPFRIASLNAADFASQLGASPAGHSLLLVAGAPACGVDFYHIEYNTVGGAGEKTTASGALLVPTGAAPAIPPINCAAPTTAVCRKSLPCIVFPFVSTLFKGVLGTLASDNAPIGLTGLLRFLCMSSLTTAQYRFNR